jgi:hypothetical protein
VKNFVTLGKPHKFQGNSNFLVGWYFSSTRNPIFFCHKKQNKQKKMLQSNNSHHRHGNAAAGGGASTMRHHHRRKYARHKQQSLSSSHVHTNSPLTISTSTTSKSATEPTALPTIIINEEHMKELERYLISQENICPTRRQQHSNNRPTHRRGTTYFWSHCNHNTISGPVLTSEVVVFPIPAANTITSSSVNISADSSSSSSSDLVSQ